MWERKLQHPMLSNASIKSPWSGETFGLNLRFLLIVTVFVANAIEPLIHAMPEMKALFLWIFTFHMPLFVGVTGYFARSNLFSEKGNRILRQIALQYVVFQSIYSLLDYLLFRVPGVTHSFFVPYLLLWFLIGHLVWRIVLRVFIHKGVKHPVLWSIALGVLVGFIPFGGAWFAISRTFVYLPFFVIGYSCSLESLRKRVTIPIRIIGALVSAGLLVGLYLLAPQIEPIWLMNNMTFNELGWIHDGLSAIMLRFAIYLIEFIASIAFLAWVPQRICAITDLGRRTLYVFLLHGLIVRFAEYFGLYQHVTSGIAVSLLIIFSIGCTVLLAQPIVRNIAHPLIEPNGEAVFGWVRRDAWRRRMKHS
ncbi:fucose 4-O-acetylase [Paenibacillus sp. ACRRX]|uniref:acyltransferase family protein n=1 Tax=Paenibacillus sp. ACRRX TaxID=2918206 RepID=UPI001EF6A500|nr:fucose 4-O-acetylase [Paenibacillus sp. ACRRX]MCG7410294.1 fucose 4-O-acetylase [Paenibacillus sp. ACRRX]